jgi:radical SAM protein with 4Fe4S-binding SPASM domain
VCGKRAKVVKGISSGAPRIISWNITLRCPLKCAHCYVDAGEREAEQALSTEEAFDVIDQIRAAGKPVVVLSGGEPLLREDVYDIAAYGTSRGLRMVMGTSGFLIDRDAASRLREAGIRAAAISLDSADPQVHDAFRGVGGVWERAVQALRHCQDEGIGVQINMSVMHPAIKEIERVIRLGTSLGVRDYQLFFPVPTGRARETDPIRPQEYEDLIRQVLIRFRDNDLNIRPTCAPQFRRIASDLGISNNDWGRGCIAGISYCRIYANGDVTPCPYLPVRVGNIRKTSFSLLWERSPVFAALRDSDHLTGKCGRCSFRRDCGGCRARAYNHAGSVSPGWCDGLAEPDLLKGDLCSEDPFCPYEPGVVAQ